MGSSVPNSAVAFLAMLTTVCADMAVYTQSIPHTVMEEFRDMPASFGEELPFEGLRGFLVHGSPSDGCSALAPPPNNTDNFTGKWIVLVARYNCSFEEKVRNAQDAGYDCAIVHNVNSSELETMSAKDPVGIIIPSVFVSDIAGFQLADKFLYTYGFYIMVNGDLPFNINTHLLLPFAIVVVLCLIVILIFLIVKCIKDRRRARRHRLPNRSLRKIPTCKFSKGDPYDTCAICLDDYTEGERLRVLPCAHAYHAACIDPWLTQNKRVCPVCKRRVLAAGEARPREDSDDSDTEPLLAATTLTQGGTFDEQRENPFVRAARFMSRLRLGHDRPLDETDVVDENEPTESMNDSVTDERASLLPDARTGASVTPAPVHHASSPARHSPAVTTPLVPSVVTVTERRGRRSRRNRNARDTHSINNTEPQGEIGVAALPAPQPPQPPPHVDL